MLTAYLREHPLMDMLTEEPLRPVPGAGDRQAWDGVPGKYRTEILREAENFADQPYPMRRATDFLAFVRNGSRKADEDPYFFRRRKLCYAALACCLGETRYLDDVADGIWCICEETSWVISAHNVNPVPGAPRPADVPLPDPERPYIDLFAAQTGMILTLVKQMLRRELDHIAPALTERITRELRGRILQPFLTHDEFWWMGNLRKDLNNWTPWILSNVLLSGLTEPLPRSERTELAGRACAMLDRWLETVPEDGGCDEGAGYWNMAGGAMLDCLQLMEEATGGAMALWREPKIRNILTFPRKAEIGNGWFMNFADCDARPFLSGERVQTAGEKTGDPLLTALGARHRDTAGQELSDVPHLIRLIRLLFHPAPPEAGVACGGDEWLPDLQVRLVRRDGLILCAKGGHNAENHNHNDVGSFMLYADGEPELVDAGNMIYTAQTFSDRRYELWNTRSAWHNVPLIGEEEQQAGAEYRAEDVRALPDGLELEAAKAYGAQAGALSFRRRLELKDGGLLLRDRIELKEARPVTWVFLFRSRPEKTAGSLRTERLTLRIPENVRLELEEKKITDTRMARNYPGSLWRVRLTCAAAPLHEMTWRFTRRENI